MLFVLLVDNIGNAVWTRASGRRRCPIKHATIKHPVIEGIGLRMVNIGKLPTVLEDDKGQILDVVQTKDMARGRAILHRMCLRSQRATTRAKDILATSHGAQGHPQSLGMAPLPPPPLPPPSCDASWMNLAPPFPTNGLPTVGSPVPTSTVAETKLKEVMSVLKKNETELPTEVAEIVKDTSLKDGLQKIQNMHDAVENLGNAQQALEQACFERAQNLASWRQFLHLSVQRWQEYTQHFQAQERHFMEGISQHREAVKRAQLIFKELQDKGVITVEADEDPAMLEETAKQKALARSKMDC
eukprot:s5384_g1.t1